MNEELTADMVKTWTQDYKGVAIQIKFWGLPTKPDGVGINEGHGMWNYYITIKEAQCPDFFDGLFWFDVTPDSDPDRPFYNYHTDATDAMELHGGITFYKRHNSPDYAHRAAEFGCDYGHYWDQEIGYPSSKDSVWTDAKHSVDLLIEYLSDQNKTLLTKCRWNGKYYIANQIDSRGYGPVGQEKNKV